MCQRLYMHFYLVFIRILQGGQYHPYLANKELETTRDWVLELVVATWVPKAPKTDCLLHLGSFFWPANWGWRGAACEAVLSGLLPVDLNPRSALTSSVTPDNCTAPWAAVSFCIKQRCHKTIVSTYNNINWLAHNLHIEVIVDSKYVFSTKHTLQQGVKRSKNVSCNIGQIPE